MKLSKPVLLVLLAVDFIAAMSSFGFIMELTERWNAGESMAVIGIWAALFAFSFGPILNRLL